MKFLALCFLLFFVNGLWSQNPARFADEILEIQKKYDTLLDTSKETIVFVGSSSIRMWHNIQEQFSEHRIINAGFGGSQASDLLLYTKELILNYKPKKIFIYEGDNDIFAGKTTKEIIGNMRQIIAKIKANNPVAEIMLLAAKPSVARWNYRRQYKKLNRNLKKLSKTDTQLYFVDVWKPMLKKRKVMPDIFIEDKLHMNDKGYMIWYETIKPFLK